MLASTRHEAKVWNLRRSQRQSQTSLSTHIDEELDEGLQAYADEHAAIETSRANAFEVKWSVVREKAQAAIDGRENSQAEGAGLTVVELEVGYEDEYEDDDA